LAKYNIKKHLSVYRHSFLGTLIPQQLQSSSSSQVSSSTDSSNNSLVKLENPSAKATALADSTTMDITDKQTITEEMALETKASVNNPCVLCWKEEKRLACIPCGHLAACINCSQQLRACPICRRGIEAFVRIYI